jgi:hypothetical protein
MLLRNDLLRYEDDDRTVRVLWLRADSAGAAIIEMSSEVALPSIVRVDALLQDVQEKRARLLNPDPTLCWLSKRPSQIATRLFGIALGLS